MIEIGRRIQVKSFEAEATVAVARARPEFLAVAQLAEDTGAPIDGADIARELLGGLPAQVGWRVLERCCDLGLLERGGERGPAGLSAEGRQALAIGQVFVPEESAWRIWWSEDPLLDDPFLHIEQVVGQTMKEDRNELRQKKAEKQPISDPTPEVLRRLANGGRMLSSAVDGMRCFLRGVAGRGLVGRTGEGTMTLQWPVAVEPTLRLAAPIPRDKGGKVRRVELVKRTAPRRLVGLSYAWLWTTLVGSASGRSSDELNQWASVLGRRVLPIRLDECSDEERRTLQRVLAFKEVELGPLGRFGSVVLPPVELIPSDARQAQAWVEWLQWDALRGYAVPEQLAAKGAEIRGRFPEYAPTPLDAGALLERAKRLRGDPRARFVLAPADLGLWGAT